MWSSSGCHNTPSQWTQLRSSWRRHPPVLRYYDVNKPVTVQCDTSQAGLGAVLLQDGQPVCYASWALGHLVVWQNGPIPLGARHSHYRDWPWTIEVHIQKRYSQVTQASVVNAAGPTKVEPRSAMQERYTNVYCRCIELGISEDHWWSSDEVLWDSCTWDSWTWRAYSN